jgi:plastocyanin
MKKIALALALALASLALVACGGSGSSSSTESTAGEAAGKPAGSGAALDIETASSGLEYSSDTATAKAGKVTLDFTNNQPLTHDVAIENSSGETIGQTELIAEGSDSTVVDLKPGTYHYYCTVPGHREAGMEGTLTVK